VVYVLTNITDSKTKLEIFGIYSDLNLALEKLTDSKSISVIPLNEFLGNDEYIAETYQMFEGDENFEPGTYHYGLKGNSTKINDIFKKEKI